MKKVTRWLIICALLLAAHGAGAIAEDSQTLTGEFVWDQRGNRGDLEAVFTATGENTWNVDFHFTFRGSPHTYSGTAEGSLSQGALSVVDEGKGTTNVYSVGGRWSLQKGTTGSSTNIADGRTSMWVYQLIEKDEGDKKKE